MNVAAAGATGSSRSRRFSAIVNRDAVVESLSAAARDKGGEMVRLIEATGTVGWGEAVTNHRAPSPTTCAHCGGRYVLDEGDLKCFACGRSSSMPDEQRAMLMAEEDRPAGKRSKRGPIPGGVWRDLAVDGGAS